MESMRIVCLKMQKDTSSMYAHILEPMYDHIKPVVRRKPSLVVVHVGTNDITNNVDTEEMLQTLANDVKKESPDTEISISELVNRKDIEENREGIEKKVANLNSRLKNLCARNQLYFIENDRVDDSCVAKKKLHLNIKGNFYYISKKLC